MSDGAIKIDTKLDNAGIKKDIQEVNKVVASAGKTISDSMNKAESSVKKVGTAFNSIDGKKIASQMKSVESAIDKTSTKIDGQKKKLAELKTSYEKATDTKSKSSIEKDMQKAEASIVKLESKLTGLNNKKIKLDIDKNALNGLDGEFKSASESATKSLDKIEKKAEETGNIVRKSMGSIAIGDGIIKVGDKISSVGNKLTMGVTLPVVGLGTAIGKIGMDFDAQMSRVSAISEATGEDFTKLKNQALQLGKDTAFSSKNAAEGMENLASAGFNTQEIMQAMPGMLDLAASSGESLASSSDIAASTLRGFGLAASDAGHVADVLAKNASATNAAVADTGLAMKYVAPVAHSMGISLEEVTAAIGELSNSGIKSEQAGTTLRSMLTRLASPSSEAAKAMQSIGFSAFDAQGKLKPFSDIIEDLNTKTTNLTEQKKADTIATIFGQEALSGTLVLMQGGKKGLDDLTNSYKTADGAAKTMAKTMQDNSKSSVEQMMGSLETAAIKLEEVAAPSIIAIADKIQELANEFSDLSPETQQSIIEFTLLAAATGPVVKTIGGVTSGIGSLIKYGSKLGTMLGILKAGATTGEVALGGLSLAGGLAVGAAAALTIGIAGVVTHNELLGRSCVTSTEDLTTWEQAVNKCTGSTIKSKAELQKAGLVYKDFGEGVSDSFKSGIEEATKTYHNFEMTLVDSNSGEKITDEGSRKITSAINAMIDGAKSSIAKRKGEVQSELSKMFNSKDGIDADEQGVIDVANQSSDEKLKKIEEIQGQITGVWEKAIAEHGKLGEEDIAKIKDYLQQVQQIRAEVEAKNTAESDFAKNQYGERLKGISGDDARKEYTSASEDLKKKFADARATYKTGIDDLNRMEKEAEESGDQDKVAKIQKQVDLKKEEYDKLISTEKTKRREYLDMLYEKNGKLNGTLNEEDGTLFNAKDYSAKSDLSKITSQFDEVAKATESGMKRVQDASGKWHDIYVEVDQGTGNITSVFDTFTGKFGGYSKKLADDAQLTGEQVAKSMQELAANVQYGIGNLKLEGSSIVKIDTGEAISKMQTIIEKADKTKVAIANINGEQVKIEFNKDGTIKNADDIRKAVVDHLASSPAKVDIDVNDKEALEKFKNAEDEADKLDNKEPVVEADVETDEANKKIEETDSKIENLDGKEAELTVKTDANNSESILDNIFSTWRKLIDSDNVITKTIKTVTEGGGSFLSSLGIGNNYTGTNGGDESLSFVNEIDHGGWEISSGSEQIAYLGSGSSIMPHMTSLNEMNREISNQVGNSMGKVIGTLGAALLNQTNTLAKIAFNTAQTVVNGKQANQLNEKMASDLVSKLNSSVNGTFAGVNKQISDAKEETEKANNMKAENSQAYIDAKAEVDRISDMTTDAKKALGEEQLKIQKDNADKALDLAKSTAELDITIAKQAAQEKTRIAEEAKNKMIKIAEATTSAIKNKITEEKNAADKAINDELASTEKAYNSKIAMMDKEAKAKTKSIDDEIAALEKQSTVESREDERKSSKDKINALRTKQANTKSQADKDRIELEIQAAQKELNTKENEWDITDKKAELEEEKTLISERTETRKAAAKEDYDNEKESLEKKKESTDEYYSKLLETDSLNAQARYMMLTASSEELVALLNSYAPGWQDAGQALADSLLNGLNSQNETVQQAIDNMINIRGGSNLPPPTIGKLEEGYESGTNYNQSSGLYNVDENKFELASRGSVAYVTKGAAIKNHMQSEDYIDRQVEAMKNSILASNASMVNQVLNNISNNTNNSVTHNDNGLTLSIDKFINNSSHDIEQIANELSVYSNRQKKA